MTILNQSIPARAGVGFKPQHLQDIFTGNRDVHWFEVHPENYFGDGGTPHQSLTRIRESYPLSMHGVGLSLGSADGLDRLHLKRLKQLIERYQPARFSEHLSWSRFQQHYSNDLLPTPYTNEALTIFENNIQQAQDFLGRSILIENPSSYFSFERNDFTEWDFIVSLCQATGAGILLDINNLYVSAINHGFNSTDYLDAIPANLVHEIHLAGHATEQHDFGPLLIDDHGSSVCDEVWSLYQQALDRIGPKATLIEWDTNIPGYAELAAQAQLANQYLNPVSEVMAE